ncbi:MAG: ribosome maturation factor RimP [Eubacterium sp.]|nr:ribosome maturation factor RimP [Eubacterium sp.]
MKRVEIEKRTEELVLDIINGTEIELWDVEYVKEGSEFYLRVYIDKPGGITIDDCVEVNRALNPKLDEEDFVEEAYILEVSSPGLTRKLKKDRDFEKSIGKLVHIKLYKAESGSKEFIGRLVSFDEEKIVIKSDDGDDGSEVSLDRSNVSSARLEFEE